ncbi:hypothetical protein PPL_02115 [Heterostelium album PN500]|uniref:RanBP2-type domain-containing protein n=1 Tax=Heterostelium pallidum (strain ATCC 26659 / Pp 5 / PN500) TaxID=670386 RepID=D3B1E4_HETP5|nr:hypothetical protein PPL_02115 [Heterostelium album PN500]EFA85118.1 hypothetical protein PPL_02115 [Heterostelium album PN500]|eukprot:XP_020437227.1 hypothetical protein PPL_02115 [Heterostelium album PN500]
MEQLNLKLKSTKITSPFDMGMEDEGLRQSIIHLQRWLSTEMNIGTLVYREKLISLVKCYLKLESPSNDEMNHCEQWLLKEKSISKSNQQLKDILNSRELNIEFFIKRKKYQDALSVLLESLTNYPEHLQFTLLYLDLLLLQEKYKEFFEILLSNQSNQVINNINGNETSSSSTKIIIMKPLVQVERFEQSLKFWEFLYDRLHHNLWLNMKSQFDKANIKNGHFVSSVLTEGHVDFEVFHCLRVDALDRVIRLLLSNHLSDQTATRLKEDIKLLKNQVLKLESIVAMYRQYSTPVSSTPASLLHQQQQQETNTIINLFKSKSFYYTGIIQDYLLFNHNYDTKSGFPFENYMEAISIKVGPEEKNSLIHRQTYAEIARQLVFSLRHADHKRFFIQYLKDRKDDIMADHYFEQCSLQKQGSMLDVNHLEKFLISDIERNDFKLLEDAPNDLGRFVVFSLWHIKRSTNNYSIVIRWISELFQPFIRRLNDIESTSVGLSHILVYVINMIFEADEALKHHTQTATNDCRVFVDQNMLIPAASKSGFNNKLWQSLVYYSNQQKQQQQQQQQQQQPSESSLKSSMMKLKSSTSPSTTNTTNSSSLKPPKEIFSMTTIKEDLKSLLLNGNGLNFDVCHRIAESLPALLSSQPDYKSLDIPSLQIKFLTLSLQSKKLSKTTLDHIYFVLGEKWKEKRVLKNALSYFLKSETPNAYMEIVKVSKEIIKLNINNPAFTNEIFHSLFQKIHENLNKCQNFNMTDLEKQKIDSTQFFEQIHDLSEEIHILEQQLDLDNMSSSFNNNRSSSSLVLPSPYKPTSGTSTPVNTTPLRLTRGSSSSSITSTPSIASNSPISVRSPFLGKSSTTDRREIQTSFRNQLFLESKAAMHHDSSASMTPTPDSLLLNTNSSTSFGSISFNGNNNDSSATFGFNSQPKQSLSTTTSPIKFGTSATKQPVSNKTTSPTTAATPSTPQTVNFTKPLKPGQWQCVCCDKVNEAKHSNCELCLIPNPDPQPFVPEVVSPSSNLSPAFGSTPTPVPAATTSSTPVTAPVFGAPSSTMSFGTSTTTSAFGTTTTTPAFGSTTIPTFGNPTPTPKKEETSLFGNPTPVTKKEEKPLFGNPTSTPAKTTEEVKPLFGSTASSTTPMFGSTTSPNTSLFGNPTPAPKKEEKPLFGNPTPAKSNEEVKPLFGSTPAATGFTPSSGGFSFNPSQASKSSTLFPGESSKEELKEGQWKCACCETVNEVNNKTCNICMVPNPTSAKTSPLSLFGNPTPTPKKEEKPSTTSSTTPLFGNPTPAKPTEEVKPLFGSTPAATGFTPSSGGFSFNPSQASKSSTLFPGESSKEELKEGQWKCACCENVNELNNKTCNICMVPNPASAKTALFGNPTPVPKKEEKLLFGNPTPAKPTEEVKPLFGSTPVATGFTPSSGGFSFNPSQASKSSTLFPGESSKEALKEGQWKCACCENVNELQKPHSLEIQHQHPSTPPVEKKDTSSLFGNPTPAQKKEEKPLFGNPTPAKPTEEVKPLFGSTPAATGFTPSSGGFSFNPSQASKSSTLFPGESSKEELKEGQWKCACCETVNEANNKTCNICMVPNPTAAKTSLFGNPTPTPSTPPVEKKDISSLFGNPTPHVKKPDEKKEEKPLFGSTTPSTSSFFGNPTPPAKPDEKKDEKPSSLFGSTTSPPSSLIFGNPNQSNNLFASPSNTSNIFGKPGTTTDAPIVFNFGKDSDDDNNSDDDDDEEEESFNKQQEDEYTDEEAYENGDDDDEEDDQDDEEDQDEEDDYDDQDNDSYQDQQEEEDESEEEEDQPPSFIVEEPRAKVAVSFGSVDTPNTPPTGNVSSKPQQSVFGNPSTSVFGGAPTASTSSVFGGSTSVFGSQTTPASNSTPSTSSVFGSSGSSVFGNNQPTPAANTSVFTQNAQPTVFGSTSASVFGAKPVTSVFGSSPASTTPAAASTSSVFGTNPTPSTAPTSSVFGGSPTPTKPAAPTSVFGNAPTSSVFGNPTPSTPAAPTSVFGTAPTSSVFGKPAAAPTSVFGNPTPTKPAAAPTSVFGTSPTTPSTSASSIFGNPTPSTPAAPTSVFGNPTSPTPAAASTSSVFGKSPATPSTSATSVFGTPVSTANIMINTTPKPTILYSQSDDDIEENKTAFGGAPSSVLGKPVTSIFGRPSTPQTISIFGGDNKATEPSSAPTSVFGPSAFDRPAKKPVEPVTPFQPSNDDVDSQASLFNGPPPKAQPTPQFTETKQPSPQNTSSLFGSDFSSSMTAPSSSSSTQSDDDDDDDDNVKEDTTTISTPIVLTSSFSFKPATSTTEESKPTSSGGLWSNNSGSSWTSSSSPFSAPSSTSTSAFNAFGSSFGTTSQSMFVHQQPAEDTEKVKAEEVEKTKFSDPKKGYVFGSTFGTTKSDETTKFASPVVAPSKEQKPQVNTEKIEEKGSEVVTEDKPVVEESNKVVEIDEEIASPDTTTTTTTNNVVSNPETANTTDVEENKVEQEVSSTDVLSSQNVIVESDDDIDTPETTTTDVSSHNVTVESDEEIDTPETTTTTEVSSHNVTVESDEDIDTPETTTTTTNTEVGSIDKSNIEQSTKLEPEVQPHSVIVESDDDIDTPETTTTTTDTPSHSVTVESDEEIDTPETTTTTNTVEANTNVEPEVITTDISSHNVTVESDEDIDTPETTTTGVESKVETNVEENIKLEPEVQPHSVTVESDDDIDTPETTTVNTNVEESSSTTVVDPSSIVATTVTVESDQEEEDDSVNITESNDSGDSQAKKEEKQVDPYDECKVKFDPSLFVNTPEKKQTLQSPHIGLGYALGGFSSQLHIHQKDMSHSQNKSFTDDNTDKDEPTSSDPSSLSSDYLPTGEFNPFVNSGSNLPETSGESEVNGNTDSSLE